MSLPKTAEYCSFCCYSVTASCDKLVGVVHLVYRLKVSQQNSQDMHGLFALNADVLSTILSYTGPYDALQLSLTCRDAQRAALPRFLASVVFPSPWLCSSSEEPEPEPPVHRHPELYERFRSYMLADGSYRLRQLKALALGEDAFCVHYGGQGSYAPRHAFTLAAPLADVIRGAAGLHTIRVAHADAIFDAVPQLADAIASLPQLQEVCFYDADVSTLEVLSRMHSRPRKVSVRIVEYTGVAQTWWGQYVRGGSRFLCNFTETLEVLSLIGGLDILEELEPDTVWPVVRELKLARGPSVNLQVMSNAFPHLRRLHVECPAATFIPVDQWRELDFVFTTHPLPLQHPVRHLKMSWFSLGPYVPTPQHQALVDSTNVMLRNTQPVVLECSACKSIYSCIARNAPSVHFLRITGAPTRRHSESERQLSDDMAEALLTYDFSLLKILPLKGAAVVLQRCRPWCEPSHWMRYARVIAACIPTLEYVGLRQQVMARSPVDQWDGSERYMWYRITGREEKNEPVIEILSEEEGNSIHFTLLNLSRDNCD
ncbi:hypothetical protein DAEQUDRAFT_48666 [Daedalea quercina L-15889]|uniref:F-box domain-containing protein n=1 Tax=Daedalea quercina L-15889 TaxID=1314783 RepID=A0A165LAI9_9APHY|nr:hypothetical protein DAEQUDRAFT_48666 [Daedalea quercina L-15889]